MCYFSFGNNLTATYKQRKEGNYEEVQTAVLPDSNHFNLHVNVNFDGYIDVSDVVLIAQYDSQMINSFY